VRDPLLTLGCRDPIEWFEELAAADPQRPDELAIITSGSSITRVSRFSHKIFSPMCKS
jgi:hypothetical protein